MTFATNGLLFESYPRVRLNTVATFRHGGTPSKSEKEFWQGDIPWVSPKDMGGENTDDAEDRISQEALNKSSASLVPKGSLLIVIRSGILARRIPVALTRTDVAFNQDIKAVLPIAGVLDSQYLRFVLKTQESSILETGVKIGATVHSIRSGYLENLEIPLPHLSKQTRIAAILTERLAAVEQARKASEARIEAARALSAAYLREVFESEEAKGWQKARLAELVLTRLRTGLSKPGSPDSDKQCLTLSSVRNGGLLLDKVKPTDISDEEAQRNQLKAGAFYIVRGNGNKSLVGRGGIAPQECNGVIFPDLLFEVNSDPKLLSVLFLRWAWDSESVRNQIEEKSMTAAGIFKINQRNLASIELRIPSLPVQERIAADLYKRNSKVLDIQALTDQELAAINAVPASLLRQAFSGAL